MPVPEKFNRGNPRYWNRLYQQNKDGTFTDVTKSAGLANVGAGDYGMGVAVGDYDNDGYPDLFVTNYGRNILYHNNGDGTFTDVAAAEGVQLQDDLPTSAHKVAAWGDYNDDGFLDLVLKDGVGPTAINGDGAQGFHFLFKNNGGRGRFIKVNLQGVQSNRNGIGAREK